MSILDVLQIFGRAGRPQYDNTGHAILITPHKSLNNYCALLGHQVGIDVGVGVAGYILSHPLSCPCYPPSYTPSTHTPLHLCSACLLQPLHQQAPIDSTFIKSLADHMNAEIVNGTVIQILKDFCRLTHPLIHPLALFTNQTTLSLHTPSYTFIRPPPFTPLSGTITNIREASSWLSYTFLFVRMGKNPVAYGMSFEEKFEDPQLDKKRVELVRDAAELLDRCMMIR